MKTTLRLQPHLVLTDAPVIEVWHGDEFIATIVGADGPGVRVLSKHEVQASSGMASVSVSGQPVNEIAIAIAHRRAKATANKEKA